MAKRLTSVEWATVVTLYERGEKTVKEMAEQFGVSPQAIREGLRTRGATRDSRLPEVKSEVEDAARAEHARRVADAQKVREDHAKYIKVLTQLAVKKVSEAASSGSLPLVNADMLTLKNAMAIVATGRRELWDILDIAKLMDEEEELPDLNIGEYSPDEIDTMRDANEADYQETIDEDED